jgi:ABC-type multidrug transport system fused ATPase/permease subunit
MWHDFGYIEDDRPPMYDFALIRRLLHYAAPYRLLILLTSLLIVAATAADLAMPYLIKVAVDRHIVVSARELTLTETTDPRILKLTRSLEGRLTPTGLPDHFFLTHGASSLIDPQDLTRLENSGVLSRENYYLVQGKPTPLTEMVLTHRPLFKSYPKLDAIAIDDLQRLEPREVRLVRSQDIDGLLRIALWACLILVIGYVLEFSQVILLEYVGQKITHGLRQDLVAHVLRQSVAFHDRVSTGRLVARITNDIQNLGEMIKSVAVTFFKDSFILIGIVGILVYIDWRLATITLTLVPLIIAVTIIFRNMARKVFRDLRAKVALINSAFGETIAGIRIIQVFRRERLNRRIFGELNLKNFEAGVRQIKIFAVFMPLIELLSAVALGMIIWYGGLSVLDETMTLGAVVAFIGYMRKFFQPIRDLAEKFNILQSSMASLERIFNLMDQQSTLPTPPHPLAVPPGPGAMEFDHVSFSYDGNSPVLDDLSLRIAAGETVAIVGATGAGKTSIINLLLRFYDVTSGRILVDGLDIRELDQNAHRSRIGLVMQDVFLFAGTIRENISFSRDNQTTADLETATRAAGADEFIAKLPNGYDELLGEGGLSLSAGQRQLISFARVLAQDPQILVLDEATAQIDSETEILIEQALQKLTQGRTSIIIAHRLSTIRRADRIMVLHKGQIKETGTHRELLDKKGLYYHLHELQFKRRIPLP